MAAEEYIMVRIRRDTHARLRQLQEQLGTSEGRHAYYLRDWKGNLVFSLDSVVNVLLDRNDDHKRRSNKRTRQDTPGREESLEDPRVE